MDSLLFYHDFTSPFSRLAAGISARAATQTGLRIRAVPLELRPPGTPLPQPESPEIADELRLAIAAADDWGMELGTLPFVPRTAKAHEAVAFARAEGHPQRLMLEIYDALWVRGEDIARIDVLADIGGASGLDRDALHVALGTDRLGEAVAREQEAAIAAGLTGVPAFQVGEVMAVGLFPLDELLSWIEQNR